MFEVRNRAYTDNSISEIAGKILPAHPTARYKTFTDLWKKTRRPSGYLPRPITCATKENDFFPCCLSCGANSNAEDIKELLARRSANAGWISADWWWDFGWLLPEGFVNYGIGVTVPKPSIKRDRVFVLNQNLARNYLDVDLRTHVQVGSDQHEAKARVSNQGTFELVAFEGQMLIDRNEYIIGAIPRSQWWTDGKEPWQRYLFQTLHLSYSFSNLVLEDDNLKVEDEKVFFKGMEL